MHHCLLLYPVTLSLFGSIRETILAQHIFYRPPGRGGVVGAVSRLGRLLSLAQHIFVIVCRRFFARRLPVVAVVGGGGAAVVVLLVADLAFLFCCVAAKRLRMVAFGNYFTVVRRDDWRQLLKPADLWRLVCLGGHGAHIAACLSDSETKLADGRLCIDFRDLSLFYRLVRPIDGAAF